MKTYKIIFCFLLLVLIPGSCVVGYYDSITGDGNVVKEVRNVSDFTGIKVSSGIDVYLTQGQNTEVILEADQNLHEWITTEVVGSILHIKSEKNIRMAESKIVWVSCPVINLIDISSAGDVIGENMIITDKMDIDMSSAGDLDAYDLLTESADVSVSSAGHANVFVTGEAKFRSSSAGDINYRGDPKIIEMHSSSAGTINKK
jgi:hypothetical protein